MKARTWLTAVTVSTAAAVALMGGFTYISVSKLIESHQKIVQSRELIETLEHLLYRVADAGSTERAYLITGQDGYLDAYRDTKDELYDCLKDLKVMLQDNPAQLARYNKLHGMINERISSFDVTLELYKANQSRDEAFKRVSNGGGMAFRKSSRDLIDMLKRDEVQRLTERLTEVNKKAEASQATVLFGTIFAVLFICLMNILLRQRIINCVERLLKASSNIEHGRYDTVVSIHTEDEFADLAEAFSILGQKLQQMSDALSQEKQSNQKLSFDAVSKDAALNKLVNRLEEISDLAKEEVVAGLNLQEMENAIVGTVEKIGESRSLIDSKSLNAKELAEKAHHDAETMSQSCLDMSLKLSVAFDKSEQTAESTKHIFELSDDIHDLIASFEKLSSELDRLPLLDKEPFEKTGISQRLNELSENARVSKVRSEKILSRLHHVADRSRLTAEDLRSQVLSLKLSAEQLAAASKRFPEIQSKIQSAVSEVTAGSRLHGSLLVAGREYVEALMKIADRSTTQIKRISLKSTESVVIEEAEVSIPAVAASNSNS